MVVTKYQNKSNNYTNMEWQGVVRFDIEDEVWKQNQFLECIELYAMLHIRVEIHNGHTHTHKMTRVSNAESLNWAGQQKTSSWIETRTERALLDIEIRYILKRLFDIEIAEMFTNDIVMLQIEHI